MINYAYTIVYVNNVEETLDFYKRAFGFEMKFISPEKNYGELVTGSTTLAFAAFSIAEYNGIEINKVEDKTMPVEIAFVCEDIEHAWKRAVEAGARIVKEPSVKPWGQTVGYVSDMDGLLIELCTEIVS